HGGAVGQRRLHRARRGGGRDRGSIRAAHEPRGRAPRPEEHQVHELDRPAGCAALQHGAGSLSADGSADPRFPERVRAVLLAKGIPLQQRQPAESKPSAVGRPERRRREDRPYRGRGLLPDRLLAPRRAPVALGAARLHFGSRARAGVAQAAQLGLPVLRQREALRRRNAGEADRGVEGRRAPRQRRRRLGSVRHRAERRSRQAQGRAGLAAAAGGAAHQGAARRRAARHARRQAVRRVSAHRAGTRGAGGVIRTHLGYTETMAEMNPVFLNGKLLPADQAHVSVLDRGFIFGDGVYELVPVYSRVPFRLDEHLARLERSLGETKIRNPYTRAQWRSHVYALIDAQSYEDQGVYFQVTRGAAKRDHAFPKDLQPTVFMMSNPLTNPPSAQVEKGGSAVSAQDNRWLRCDIKSISLIGNCLLRQLSAEAGAAETILFRDGRLTEASASNVFIVRRGVIQSPAK